MENRQAITIAAKVNAPIEKVWEFWTNPEHLKQWNNASPDWHTPSAENDLRPGGKFTYTMAARDGSFSFDFWGIYDIVTDRELITCTLGDNRKVAVKFSSQENATEIVESFDAEDQNPVEMQRAGWQAILDNFKNYTESN